MTTPTRRTMRQQTLAAAMSATPPRATGATSATASPAPAPIASETNAKRTTRAQTTPTKAPPPTTDANAVATPTRPMRARAALPIVRTPQLRPRRTPPPSTVGLRSPYDQYSLDALREECARRGLAVRAREQDSGANKPATRGKAQLVELLQEADMLAMFERQSQKKTVRRPARAVKLAPPPTPIRIAPVVAAPSVSLGAPPATAVASTSTASLATPAAVTPPPAPSKAPTAKSAAKKLGRPPQPRKTEKPVATSTAPVVTSAVLPPVVSSATNAATTLQPPAAPWLATVSASQPPASQDSASEAAKGDHTTLPAAAMQPVAQSNTVDLTEDEPATREKENMPIATSAPDKQPHQPAETLQVAQASPLVSEPSPVVSQPLASASVASSARVVSRPSAPVTTAPAAAARASAPPVSRARRGCRFRLINVVLSPDFNTRWSEMNTPVKSRADVNPFWRDVHISFLCQNSFYDKVHFEDALFESVMPSAIQNHTAHKLQQMWTEIVSTYRRTHNASLKSEEQKQFLDFCAGRLDVLYLHMALLLEPELHQLVLNETPRMKVVAPKQAVNTTLRHAATNPTSNNAPEPRSLPPVAEEPQLATPTGPERGPRFVELQNPEMLPDWLLEDQAKTAAERGEIVDYSALQAPAQPAAHDTTATHSRVKSKKAPVPKSNSAASARTLSPEIAPAPDAVHTRDMVLHSSAINSIDDSASSDYEAAEPSVPTNESTRRRAPGKRRRGATPSDLPSNELVELASSRELVAHPHKRMHTAVTTTMTRSQEMMLPPDEFDVQTNRLRKINESIDQCYRTLANKDAILNDMHREDIESDLRFYLGIKKRIQEQLVMFMHGF